MPRKPIARKWRVRISPGFTIKPVPSERAARKEVERYAKVLYMEDKYKRNTLLIKSVIIEINEGDGWVEFETTLSKDLILQHAESLVT